MDPLKLVPSLKKRRLTYPKILALVFTITAQVFTLGRVFGRATSLHESESGDWSRLDYITLYSVPAESPRYQYNILILEKKKRNKKEKRKIPSLNGNVDE